MYDYALRDIADRLAPAHTFHSRVQPLAPWFDSECREIRRDCRRLERRHRRTKSDIDRSNFIAPQRHKHDSFVAKKNKYWTDRISAERGTPAKLWQSLSNILRRDKELDSSSASSTHSADQFIHFFSHKVDPIHKDMENCPPQPPAPLRPAIASLTELKACTQDEVRRVILSMPTTSTKSCTLDPIPTFLLKESVDVLLPYLTAMT